MIKATATLSEMLKDAEAECKSLRAYLTEVVEFIEEEAERRADGCFEKDGHVWASYVKPTQDLAIAVRAALAQESGKSRAATIGELTSGDDAGVFTHGPLDPDFEGKP